MRSRGHIKTGCTSCVVSQVIFWEIESGCEGPGCEESRIFSVNRRLLALHVIAFLSYASWIWRRRRRRRRWTQLPIIAPYIYDARYHAHPYILSTTVLSDILSTTVLGDILSKHFWRAGATQQVCREGMLMHHVVCAYIFQVVVILSEEAEQNTKTTLELLLRRICLLLKQARLWRNSLD